MEPRTDQLVPFAIKRKAPHLTVVDLQRIAGCHRRHFALVQGALGVVDPTARRPHESVCHGVCVREAEAGQYGFEFIGFVVAVTVREINHF